MVHYLLILHWNRPPRQAARFPHNNLCREYHFLVGIGSSAAHLFSRISTAFLPIWQAGWAATVRNGAETRAVGRSSKHTMATSSDHRIHHMADMVQGSTFGFSHLASFSM
jgi:hypothetical protein